MKIRRKLKITLIFVVVCLVLVISASYAWLTLSLRPEVTRLDTNVGANGSLEIALLNESTYIDPLLIRTGIGGSIAAQDALEANQSWGNLIDLSDERYGLGEISLLPARLNAQAGANGTSIVRQNLLNVAEFGLDGRITILTDSTVSAIRGERAFTYYVDQQNYGVRAIGTISNLYEQQIALAEARALISSHTAAASRTVKHTWRDHGPGIVDILHQHYAAGSDVFPEEMILELHDMAEGILTALTYVDSGIRQGIIGIGASQIQNEQDFVVFYSLVSNTAVPISSVLNTAGVEIPEGYAQWVTQVEQMKAAVQNVVEESKLLAGGGTWEQVEPLLDVLLDAENAYLAEHLLSDSDAYRTITADNRITLSPGSGILAEIAGYCGNYSALCMWKTNASMEIRTAEPNEEPCLIRIEKLLEGCKAAAGGWTRANLDDTYGFAVDMAFRCNVDSDLLLQTTGMLRTTESTDIPVTQGSGSYMRFTSDDMELEELLVLMDTLRVGFLDDQNTLVALAKLNVSNYEVQEEGVFAPLYLYEFTLEEDGSITTGERRSEDASIAALPQNSPRVITVVAWLDGDQVENSKVNENSHQSMRGVMNLQFSSSADLLASAQSIEDKK